MGEQLKPCPFCGGDAERFTIEESGPDFGGDVICCQSCGASSHVEFIKLNSNLSNIGKARIDDAPLPTGVPILGVSDLYAGIDTSGPDMRVDFDINTALVPVGHSLLVYATPPIAPGRNFVKNQFRMIGTATATNKAVDVASAYEGRFAMFTASDIGKTVHVRAVLVNETTGEMGVPVGGSVVIEQF